MRSAGPAWPAVLPPVRACAPCPGAWFPPAVPAAGAADQDYAGWAGDESTQGCRAHDTADAHYQATSEANREATTDKTTFTGLWNPIAVKYNLPSCRPDEL